MPGPDERRQKEIGNEETKEQNSTNTFTFGERDARELLGSEVGFLQGLVHQSQHVLLVVVRCLARLKT